MRHCVLLAALALAGQAMAAPVEGRLDWLQRVELGTLVSGVVEEVTVQPGDRVKRGQILVRLEQAAFRAALQEAEAQLAFQRAAFEEAQRELERTQELYDRTLLANRDLELARIAHARAEAALRQAEAELAGARQALRHSVVRAPFAGVVLNRRVEPGQTVVTRLQSVPLVTVGGTERLVARAAVSGSAAAGLKAGQAVAVTVEGRRHQGSVRYVGLEPSVPGEALYPVEVVFSPPADTILRTGQAVTVELP